MNNFMDILEGPSDILIENGVLKVERLKRRINYTCPIRNGSTYTGVRNIGGNRTSRD